jgi:hypothetical protein
MKVYNNKNKIYFWCKVRYYDLPVDPGWESLMCHIEGIASQKTLYSMKQRPRERHLMKKKNQWRNCIYEL